MKPLIAIVVVIIFLFILFRKEPEETEKYLPCIDSVHIGARFIINSNNCAVKCYIDNSIIDLPANDSTLLKDSIAGKKVIVYQGSKYMGTIEVPTNIAAGYKQSYIAAMRKGKKQ